MSIDAAVVAGAGDISNVLGRLSSSVTGAGGSGSTFAANGGDASSGGERMLYYFDGSDDDSTASKQQFHSLQHQQKAALLLGENITTSTMYSSLDPGIYNPIEAENETDFLYINGPSSSYGYTEGHNGTLPYGDDYYQSCMGMYGNVTYLNVSCETILNYSIPLYGYCTPIFILITLTANSLIVIVLSKRSMASPTNFVLMGKFCVLLPEINSLALPLCFTDNQRYSTFEANYKSNKSVLIK